jgi:hypothetical protein
MRSQIADELTEEKRLNSMRFLDPIFGGEEVRTKMLDPPVQALPELDDGPIERWLFHGTNPRALEGIAEANFDLSRAGSGAGGMYGKGIYCAECSSKADEYSEQDVGGVRGLLLCRAVLGNIQYNCDKSPNVSLLQSQKEMQGSHTILADRWKAAGTYREYVFGQNEQLYPEFIIHYQREYQASQLDELLVTRFH